MIVLRLFKPFRLVKPLVLVVVVSFCLAACTTTAPAPTRIEPRDESRYLPDPRTGYGGTTPRAIAWRFDRAWSAFEAGDVTRAESGFAGVLRSDPGYLPAVLGQAAVALERGDYSRAERLIERGTSEETRVAAGIYQAEVDLLRGNPDRAYERYREVISAVGLPAATRDRFEALGSDIFEAKLAEARRAQSAEDAVTILRRALVIGAPSRPARLLLAQKLIELGRFDEASRELDPLVPDATSDADEIQRALGEIEAGKGLYQEAIARYERLSRKSPSPELTGRLGELKRLWSEANMPPQFRQAIDSQLLTRSELAVLIYWKVSAVRFAQGLGEPPIAIDTDVVGREEVVRALALRLMQVDPVTRRFNPLDPVTASSLLRIAARVLSLRGSLPCASRVSAEDGDALRGTRELEACDVPVGELRDPDALVSGRVAARILERIDRKL